MGKDRAFILQITPQEDPKSGVIELCLMQHFGLHEVVHHGKIYSVAIPHTRVYIVVFKWRDDGTLEAIFHALSEDADLENLSIDSTSVKAHPQSAGAKKGL